MSEGEFLHKLRAPTERLHVATIKMLLRSIIGSYAAAREPVIKTVLDPTFSDCCVRAFYYLR